MRRPIRFHEEPREGFFGETSTVCVFDEEVVLQNNGTIIFIKDAKGRVIAVEVDQPPIMPD